jgi:secreted trypsin-like serine protease
MRLLLLLCFALPALCENVDSRIIGGSNANIANHRWQMSLRVNNGHSCGASLISGTKGVTAAHCGGGSLGSYSTLTGTSDRTVTSCTTCAVRALTSFVRHPNYSSGGGYPNDIATIRFASIPTNANTGFITMAASNAPNYAGVTCSMTGWGRTNIGTSGSLPTILQAANIPAITNAQCQQTWGNSIIASHICVSSATASSCNGDSGGPLICSSVLAGATSWGNATCNPNQPSIYTRISSHRTWIDNN